MRTCAVSYIDGVLVIQSHLKISVSGARRSPCAVPSAFGISVLGELELRTPERKLSLHHPPDSGRRGHGNREIQDQRDFSAHSTSFSTEASMETPAGTRVARQA